MNVQEDEGVSLSWEPIDIADPEGGVIRLWPHLPTVVYPKALRRTTGEWQGLGLLLSSEEPELWAEQEESERVSRGINRDASAAQGGLTGRLMSGMKSIEDIQCGRFPDPELIRLFRAANKQGGKEQRPTYFIEPDMDDEKWLAWTESLTEELVRPMRLAGQIFAHSKWKRALKKSMKETVPPSSVREDEVAFALAEASALTDAWWNSNESMLTPELCEQRNQRFAARLRGALSNLRAEAEDAGGQFDDEAAPVLLVPVTQSWLADIAEALENHPIPETIDPTEEV